MESEMSRNLAPLSIAAALLAGTALADVPAVAVDIAPVHSLVARVMQGVGEPALIVAPGGSPHEYNLRPSEADALQKADVVFWIGPDLSPWLEGAIGTLAGDAKVVELIEVDGTTELPKRESALFEAHVHGDAEHEGEHEGEHAQAHEGEGHDDHAAHEGQNHEGHDNADAPKAHDHADHAEHDDHSGHDHSGHDHAGHDPHAWLSPDNGAAWLNGIAATLSAADPDNAGAYFANAAAGREELVAMRAEVNAMLEPVRGGKFVVFHDAYQYFETAFDFPASGAISVSDASDPSPARIAEIQARVAEQNVTCVMSEPQFNAGIIAAIMGGSTSRTGVMDPLGSDLTPGAALYPQLFRNLATSLVDCLK
jgi:zinc transport system substrate-binding protein